MLDGFKKFLLRGNVVDLAVAVVIGAAFKDVVDSMVKGLITPLIGVFGGLPCTSRRSPLPSTEVCFRSARSSTRWCRS